VYWRGKGGECPEDGGLQVRALSTTIVYGQLDAIIGAVTPYTSTATRQSTAGKIYAHHSWCQLASSTFVAGALAACIKLILEDSLEEMMRAEGSGD